MRLRLGGRVRFLLKFEKKCKEHISYAHCVLPRSHDTAVNLNSAVREMDMNDGKPASILVTGSVRSSLRQDQRT